MTLFRQTTTRYLKDGKQAPKGTPGAIKTTVKSKKWYGMVGGKKTPLSSNKSAAVQMLAEARRRWETRDDPAQLIRDAEKRPIAEHCAEFAAEVEGGLMRTGGKGRPTPRYMRAFRRMLATMTRGMGRLSDITLDAAKARLADAARPLPRPELTRDSYTTSEVRRIIGTRESAPARLARRHRLPITKAGYKTTYPRETVAALLDRRKGAAGAGAGELRHLATVVKRFPRWLVREVRLAIDPLRHLPVPAGDDGRHRRRPLSEEQVSTFLATVERSAGTVRGLTGRDRWCLYLVALGTGFRTMELASLTPASFALDETPPVVRLAAAVDKSRRKVEQPIPAALVPALRVYLGGKEGDSPLWPGTWHQLATDMLRHDLEAAGIPYAVTGPDGPLYADFHALRHTFVAMLDRAGCTLKQAMSLARHTDPRLTARIYGRADLAELSKAADRLVVGGLVAAATRNQDESGEVSPSQAKDGG